MIFRSRQGVVTPIGTIVTAVTGFKKQSRGQEMFSVSVKWSRVIFILSKVAKIQFWTVKISWPLASETMTNQVAIAQK